jgi:nitrile hydratase
MTDRFASGDRVRTTGADPAHHTRIPRYARGKTGVVVESEGSHARADDRARAILAAPEPVYAVRFSARELWGSGDHSVVLDLWESYLQPADDREGER